MVEVLSENMLGVEEYTTIYEHWVELLNWWRILFQSTSRHHQSDECLCSRFSEM